MATIPDRLEDAIDKLTTKITDEEATAIVEWVNDDRDPTEITDEGNWAKPSQSYYELVVVNLDTDTAVSRAAGKTSKRWQTGVLIIRSNIFERTRADLAREVVRQARLIQNWIEELDNGGRHRSSRGWWIDHTGWTPIRDESGEAPTPGVRVTCKIGVNQ